MGNVYLDKGEYDRAIVFYKKSLSISQPIWGEQHADVARSINSAGIAYWYKGNFDQALIYFEKALAIRRAIFDEKHLGVAMVYGNIGLVYTDKGDHDRALNYYQKELSIKRELVGKAHPSLANVYNNIGAIQWEKEDFRQAQVNFEKALTIWKTAHGEHHPLVAYGYNNLGEVYAKAGHSEKALNLLNKAIALWRKNYGDNHPNLADNYANIGRIYQQREDNSAALDYFEKALAIQQENLGDKHPLIARSYRDIGDIYRAQSDYQQTLHFYQLAMDANHLDFSGTDIYAQPPLSNILSEYQMLEVFDSKAQAFAGYYWKSSKSRRDLEAALLTYQTAAQLIDQMRSGYKTSGSKLLLAKKAKDIYGRAIQTCRQLYQITDEEAYKGQAFYFAEKSKTGVFLETLAEAEARAFARIPGSLLAKEKQLRIDLAFTDKNFIEERLKGEVADSVNMIRLQNRLFDLKRTYEALLLQFDKNYPEYYNLKYQTKAVTVRDVQKQILDKNTIIVEYFTGEDSLFIFTVTREHFDVVSVAKDSLFEKDITQMREGIYQQNYQQYLHAAYHLYQTLLAPVEQQISDKKLIFVADGLLNYVPFEALLTADANGDSGIKDYRKLPFLIKKNAVSYAYSATLLLETIHRQREATSVNYLAYAPVFPEGLPSDTRGSGIPFSQPGARFHPVLCGRRITGFQRRSARHSKIGR